MKNCVMRKWITALLMLVLLGSLPVAAYAQAPLTLSDATLTTREDTVSLTVSLNTPVTGDIVGITVTGGEDVLQLQWDQCQWTAAGDMQQFDLRGRGVLAVAAPAEFSGNLCTLVLKAKNDMPFETTVSCQVIVQNGGTVMAEQSATAKITRQCSHSYPDQWTFLNEAFHVKTCALCQNPWSASHNWDQGKVTADPDAANKQWLVYTCTDCGGTRKTLYSNQGGGGNPPGLPEVTAPTKPSPDQDKPDSSSQPTRPSKPTSPTKPTEASSEGSGNSGNSGNSGGTGSGTGSGTGNSSTGGSGNYQPATTSTGADAAASVPAESQQPMVVENHGLEDTPETTTALEAVAIETQTASQPEDSAPPAPLGILLIVGILAVLLILILLLLFFGKKRKWF